MRNSSTTSLIRRSGDDGAARRRRRRYDSSMWHFGNEVGTAVRQPHVHSPSTQNICPHPGHLPPDFIPTLTPNSHRPPDTTRQCCLCRTSGGVNWVGPTSAFCVGVRPAVAPAVSAPPHTLRRWTHLSGAVGPTQSTAPHQTRHDGPVCVVSSESMWIGRLLWACWDFKIFCRRQSWVVGNTIHTAEVDATQTRRFCCVWCGGVN